jgi:hypothetical protein
MRTLCVEDHSAELNALTRLLRIRFPNIDLLTARNSTEARARVNTLAQELRPLHVAILDLSLPRGDTELSSEEIDLKLPYYIREKFPVSLVVHYTAFTDEPSVSQHAKDFRTNARVISKGPDGPDELIATISGYWECELLKAARRCLRPDAAAEVATPPVDGPWGAVRCDTIEVNSLLREIELFGRNFSEEGRQEMSEFVVFDEKDGNLQVRLKI